MLDGDAFAHEIAALLIADIKTSGARTRGELEEACRVSSRACSATPRCRPGSPC